ncbi:hypothetical protein [uncultured Sulfitobacter sp.]|uniref:hypothetical protein n=1 Tax=uncultured Sulfitobacter sp. TaxID=191468 RepID=UPI002624EC42|nr:hypothetical protein [uncultured Sulfitobacter sp.]
MDYTSGGGSASSTKSYHNGGVEGDSFADWYDQNLASHFKNVNEDSTKGSGSGGTKGSGSGGTKGSGSGGTKGSGSGGTKGSGSGGTKGSGSGGTKGSGSGGTKGSGSGGTKGSGSGGTKGSGSGGTKGSGSGGTKGSGSGGTKGSGSGGTKGSGSGGTKGSGSGGTKGSGSGGTKGSGSGGTKGSGSGGTKGSGSGGTKGSGSGGTKGSGSGGTKGSGSGGTKGSGSGGTTGGGDPVGEKISYTYDMGEPGEISVDVTMTPAGSLFFVVRQSDFEDEPADIDGILFNVADDSTLSDLVVFPDENNTAQGDLTDAQIDANGVTELSNGAGDGNAYDVGLQFGSVPDSVEGEIIQTNFTLSSDDGRPLTFDDIDLNNMKVIVNSEYDDGAVLGVTNSDNPSWSANDAAFSTEDIMGLMNQEVDEDAISDFEDDMPDDELVFI